MKENNIRFQFGHMGIHGDDAAQASSTADLLAAMFGFVPQDQPTAVYACDQLEILKTGSAGIKGHIGILTNDLDGAIALLEARGYPFDRSRFKYSENGTLLAAYMDLTLCGFSIHLSQKEI